MHWTTWGDCGEGCGDRAAEVRCVFKINCDVQNLTERLDDSDAYEWRDTFVMSGDSQPVVSDDENTSEVVCNSIKKNLKIVVKESDISVVHRLGKKNPGQQLDRRSIIFKLCRHELRSDLISACKSARPKDFYINECLTAIRWTIQYGIRRAKRRFLFSRWTCLCLNTTPQLWS